MTGVQTCALPIWKIADEKERRDLKRALGELDPPKEYGFIIRTAGMNSSKEVFKNDLDYLLHLWDAIVKRTKSVRAPATIYQESDLVTRSIRDYLYMDVDELLIDSEPIYERAREFLQHVMPTFESRTKLYQESDPLFHRFKVDREMEKIFDRSVSLPSGGQVVIEQTEAMVAVDVNTAGFKKGDNSHETILATNLEAAKTIARQLRLRDLGGLVMIDFIDMEQAKDRKKVEKAMNDEMAGDRARSTMLPISQLGIMEMTRQRARRSLKGTLFTVCPSCRGSGLRKTPEAVALERLERLNEVTREISFRRISAMEGREARVLIDGESAVFPDFWKGRHAGQAPDVDGVVYVPREAAEPGQMLRCRLTGRHDYDLFAEPLDNS